jgi:hypothetical protein
MFKQFFIFALLLNLFNSSLFAQPGNPCDPASVTAAQNELILEGFDCLVGAGPFACVQDVFDFALATCPPSIDTSGNCDPAVVAFYQNDLIAQGAICLIGAGPFECLDDLFAFLVTNCDTTYNPCDPVVVAQVQNQLIGEGFDCLIGAGPFACEADVYAFVFENCPGDTTGGNPCDPVSVAQLQNELIAEGFECLVDAGPFACQQDVIDFALANCLPNYDDCDSLAVQNAIGDLIAEGYDCLSSAGPFTCVHEVIGYALDNCPLESDSTIWSPCFENIPPTVITFQQFLNYLAACDANLVVDVPACWFTAPAFNTDEEFLEWITVNCGFEPLMNNNNTAVNGYFNRQLASGTSNLNNAFEVSVAPNPATTEVNIRMNTGEISRIDLIDLNGRLVLTNNSVSGNQTAVNLAGIPSGIYMLRVFNTENAVMTTRVIKQ